MMIQEKPCLRPMSGYVPGEQPRGTDICKLNTNENPYPPSSAVLEAIRSISEKELGLYPPALCTPLRKKLSALFDVAEDCFLVGNGSDEILRIVFETYLEPGDSIALVAPTYSLYEVLAGIFGVTVKKYKLDNHLQIPDAFFTAPEKAVFLPLPNPPYGHTISRGALLRILEKKDRLLLLDEAYVDFMGQGFLGEIKNHDNLIISRTFSKSFSLAGIRLGFACAQPSLIAQMMKVKDSYNVNIVTQAAGLAALNDMDHMREGVKKIRATRARLMEALRSLGVEAIPSEGNFVFMLIPNPKLIYTELKKQNIFVRYFKDPDLRPGLRVTIGTDAEMDRFLAALKLML